jgi:acetyl esterase/lipase
VRTAWLAVAMALAGTSVVLLPRPLTNLMLFTVAVCVSPLAAAVVVCRRRRLQRWTGAGIILVGAASSALLIAGFARVVVAVPLVLAVTLMGVSAAALVWALRRHRVAAAWARGFWLVAAWAAAATCILWQDLSALAAGYATGLAVLAAALWCGWRGFRGIRRRSRPRPYLSIPIAGLVAVGAVGVVIASLVVLVPAARSDSFYDYAGDVPEAGTLLKVEKYPGDAPSGATALRILYSTTHVDGSPTLASAVVAIPTAPPDGERVVMAWQHGTTGIARSCAPSLLHNALSADAIPGIERAIQQGWLVVATDYPGQGTAGRYPYLIGEGEGRATLDAIRAARMLDNADASRDVMLWGHSQGGHATLWAGQIVGTYAPELRIVAVAALSAASDPLAEARAVVSAGLVSSVVTPYLLIPYADEYPDVRLSDMIHPAGLGVVRAMASRCAFDPSMLASVVSAAAVAKDAPLFAIDMNSGAAHDRLEENIATGFVPAPLFLGQGADDEVVPIAMQRKLAASVAAAGRPVEVREYPGRSHMGVIAPDSPLIDDLFRWADALLTGGNE